MVEYDRATHAQRLQSAAEFRRNGEYFEALCRIVWARRIRETGTERRPLCHQQMMWPDLSRRCWKRQYDYLGRETP